MPAGVCHWNCARYLFLLFSMQEKKTLRLRFSLLLLNLSCLKRSMWSPHGQRHFTGCPVVRWCYELFLLTMKIKSFNSDSGLAALLHTCMSFFFHRCCRVRWLISSVPFLRFFFFLRFLPVRNFLQTDRCRREKTGFLGLIEGKRVV